MDKKMGTFEKSTWGAIVAAMARLWCFSADMGSSERGMGGGGVTASHREITLLISLCC